MRFLTGGHCLHAGNPERKECWSGKEGRKEGCIFNDAPWQVHTCLNIFFFLPLRGEQINDVKESIILFITVYLLFITVVR